MNNTTKKRMWSMFKNMTDDERNSGIAKHKDSEILLVDAYNTFIRGWTASPAMNSHGEHTGGISSFLKSLGYAIKLLNPTRVIVVFDGKGGSLKRRKIYPDYKNKRKTAIRVNRAYDDTIKNAESSFETQLLRTVRYLDMLPVTTMSIDNIEADDTIAYLCTDTFKDSKLTIMSADKDFLQLVNDRITVWSPTKKKLYGCHEIYTEYGIHCENFILYRILEGDKSDNITGIRGAGLKTVLKAFPFLTTNEKFGINEIYNYCENYKGKYKVYQTILDNKHIVERNYDLMQLSDTQIQSFTQLRIEDIVSDEISKMNKIGFGKLMNEDAMWNNIPNYQIWMKECFSKLNAFVD